GHAVRGQEVGPFEDLAILSRIARVNQIVNRAEAHIPRFSASRPSNHGTHRLPISWRVHANSQNVSTREHSPQFKALRRRAFSSASAYASMSSPKLRSAVYLSSYSLRAVRRMA